jgi:phage host-nuclease inhibitor protein Gam
MSFAVPSISAMEDLLNFIEKEDDTLIGDVDTHYIIKNQDEANIYIKRYKNIVAQMNEIEETSKEALSKYADKVNTWKESCLMPLQRKLQYYETLLQQYAEHQLEGSNKKSLKLIEGTIGFRTPPVKFNYNDEEVLYWLKQVNVSDYLKETTTINKEALKKAGTIKDDKFYIDGVEVPGITLTKQDKKFVVK